MARLVVYMLFRHPQYGVYSGNFIYRCKTTGRCRWCCKQEIREFEDAGWVLEKKEVVDVSFGKNEPRT